MKQQTWQKNIIQRNMNVPEFFFFKVLQEIHRDLKLVEGRIIAKWHNINIFHFICFIFFILYELAAFQIIPLPPEHFICLVSITVFAFNEARQIISKSQFNILLWPLQYHFAHFFLSFILFIIKLSCVKCHYKWQKRSIMKI